MKVRHWFIILGLLAASMFGSLMIAKSWIGEEPKALIINGQLVQGTTTMAGNVDFANNLALNIGSANTDFTAGGLTAPYITATTAISDAGSLSAAGTATIGRLDIVDSNTYIRRTGVNDVLFGANGSDQLWLSNQQLRPSTNRGLALGLPGYIFDTLMVNNVSVGPAASVTGYSMTVGGPALITGTLTTTGVGDIGGNFTARQYGYFLSDIYARGPVANDSATCNGAVCINDNTVVTGTLNATTSATSPYITATVGFSNPMVKTGGGTIVTDATSVTFAHGLAITPTRTFANFTSNPGINAHIIWIDTCGTISCTFNVTTKVVNTSTFNWRVSNGENQ